MERGGNAAQSHRSRGLIRMVTSFDRADNQAT